MIYGIHQNYGPINEGNVACKTTYRFCVFVNDTKQHFINALYVSKFEI